MSRKKTKEEYIEQLKVKNPDVELVGDYINCHTKVPHRCNIHNVIWDIAPDKALIGEGCKQCGIEKYRKKRQKTREQYIDELSVKNPNIKLKGEYININTPTEHYCEKHDILFNTRPSDALRGKGCRQCKSEKISAKLSKSKEKYIEELAIKNPTVKLVGDYKGADTLVPHYCILHNVIWDITPNNALHGRGCKQCCSERIGNKLRKPIDDYINELAIKNPNIKLFGEYINNATPIEHYCEKHMIYFNISPNCALLGHGCSRCASEKLSEHKLKSEKQYIIDLKNVHPNIVLRGNYVGTHINTLHECLTCGCEWNPRPSNLLTGYGCPECNESKGEKQVGLWLRQHDIMYVSQKRFDDCCDKKSLPFDFYLPNYNTCIEYQGKQHYESIEYFGGEENLLYTQYHDKIKYDYCIKNSINLICIPYWENINEYLNKNLLI